MLELPSRDEASPPLAAAWLRHDPPVVPSAITSDIEERYVFEAVVGEGCFGVVRRVRDKRTDDCYACKTLPKHAARYPHRLLRREVAGLRQVQSHPHLIALREVFESETHVHIVTDLTSGGELYDRVAAGWNPSERDAAALVRNIVAAMAHCHDRGVVHRDLKASNFLFATAQTNTDVKIIDFGLSRRTKAPNEEEAEGDVAWILKSQVGTPYYVAPEMLTGESYTPLCDVWSIGVVAYAVLSRGTLPFCGADEAHTLALLKNPDTHVAFPGEAWRGRSSLAREFCRALLQRDPTLRPTAKQVLGMQWLQQDNHALGGAWWGGVSAQFWSLFESESAVAGEGETAVS